MASSPDIPPEHVEALRAQFDLFDLDGNGHISLTEVASILKREAYDHLDEAQRQAVLDSFSSVDGDDDGEIVFEEFLVLVHGRHRDDPHAAFRAAFDRIDRDSDGFLTAEDFVRVSEDQGEPISKDQAAEMIRMADENEDGKVSFEEYCRIMTAS